MQQPHLCDLPGGTTYEAKQALEKNQQRKSSGVGARVRVRPTAGAGGAAGPSRFHVATSWKMESQIFRLCSKGFIRPEVLQQAWSYHAMQNVDRL